MDHKRVGLISVALLLCATLLSGCFEVPRDTTGVTPADTTSLNSGQLITPTSAPASVNGCINVKSTAFNMGAAEGKTICLEGVISKVNLSNADATAYIDFDTTTSRNGNITYYVAIYISDRFTFGLDNIAQLAEGTHVAVSGRFSKDTLISWLIRVTDPIDVTIIP